MTRSRFCIIALIIALTATATASIAAPGSAPEAVRMRIDKNHSTVSFKVPILAGMSTVTGKFTDFAIEFDYDDAAPNRSSVSAAIQVASIDTGIDGRDRHLRTADFFDVDEHPSMTFVSDRVEIDGNRGQAYGTLTLRGTSRPVVLELELMRTGDRGLGVKATTTFDRTDFGLVWEHAEVPFFVGHDVTAELFILASMPRQERP